MKTILALTLALTATLLPITAAEAQPIVTTNQNVETKKTDDTKKAEAAKPAADKSTDKKEPEKPDIKELMKEANFTNSTGMLMVKISPSMWAGKFEVTQEEYQKIAGGNPGKFAGGRNPVDSVSWTEAKDFCAKLNEAEKKDELLPEGYAYTLPTQAQWESLVGGAELKDAVTSERGSKSGTAAVGSLGENSLGLCDVRGNLWEFCLDPQDKQYRVLRGGAWNTSYEPQLRLEFKWFSNGPDDKKENYGFRVVLVPEGQ
ncbi:MAG: hypothetical protein EXS35_13065 [Pedosphaera sp.]|nr:hypothetical protein [Pedosphaera sp.]